MRLLRCEATIPLPDIGCPYIIMSFASGTTLYTIWFGHRLNGVISREAVRACRTRALESIASAMVQLDAISRP
ncbi:hypothetical protein B0H67DRAFT_595894 [Lasiosphaeris hirsuta]|uniref:Uncharacterized protein n=1 Tax=Lasiosphaeris hirsuta TaxID=260670 RepID=A0AA40DH01_9PEZI|nr:hypothetical protein B0H67DRAFT_595894 [Lasiosphaeris hirsuta]